MIKHDTNRYGTCVTIDCPMCNACRHGNPKTGCSTCQNELLQNLNRWPQPKLGKREPAPTPALKVALNEKHLGWQCPVCNAVWAPFVRRCDGCRP